jgi:hypothetical protein
MARIAIDSRRGRILARSILLAPFLACPCAASAAEQSAAEIVRLVRERIAANYAPVKTIQPKIVMVVVNPSVKEETTIEPDNIDGIGLSVTFSPRSELKWNATIAGADQRYEVGDPGSEFYEMILRRDNLEVDYNTGGQKVWLSRFAPERSHSKQYDPRESVSMPAATRWLRCWPMTYGARK